MVKNKYFSQINRAMTKFLTHTRMIIISQQGENYKTGVLASSPVRKELGRHLSDRINQIVNR